MVRDADFFLANLPDVASFFVDLIENFFSTIVFRSVQIMARKLVYSLLSRRESVERADNWLQMYLKGY